MLRDGFCLIDRFNANFLSLLRATYATQTVNWCAVLFILFNVVMNAGVDKNKGWDRNYTDSLSIMDV